MDINENNDHIVWRQEDPQTGWILYTLTTWLILGALCLFTYYVHFALMVVLLIIGIPLAIFISVKLHDHRKKLDYTITYTNIVLSDREVILLFETLTERYGLPYTVTIKPRQVTFYYGIKEEEKINITGFSYYPHKEKVHIQNNDQIIRDLFNELFDGNTSKRSKTAGSLDVENIRYFVSYKNDSEGFPSDERNIRWRRTFVVVWMLIYIFSVIIFGTILALYINETFFPHLMEGPGQLLIMGPEILLLMPIVLVPVFTILLNFKYHYPDMYFINKEGIHYKYRSSGYNELIEWKNVVNTSLLFYMPFVLKVEVSQDHPVSPANRFSVLTKPDAHFVFYMPPWDIIKTKEMFKSYADKEKRR